MGALSGTRPCLSTRERRRLPRSGFPHQQDHKENGMKLTLKLSIAGLLLLGARLAAAGTPASGTDFSGTYTATLPERAEILNLHRDGTAEITLSDQVTAGAGGFIFS